MKKEKKLIIIAASIIVIVIVCCVFFFLLTNKEVTTIEKIKENWPNHLNKKYTVKAKLVMESSDTAGTITDDIENYKGMRDYEHYIDIVVSGSIHLTSINPLKDYYWTGYLRYDTTLFLQVDNVELV